MEHYMHPHTVCNGCMSCMSLEIEGLPRMARHFSRYASLTSSLLQWSLICPSIVKFCSTHDTKCAHNPDTASIMYGTFVFCVVGLLITPPNKTSNQN